MAPSLSAAGPAGRGVMVAWLVRFCFGILFSSPSTVAPKPAHGNSNESQMFAGPHEMRGHREQPQPRDRQEQDAGGGRVRHRVADVEAPEITEQVLHGPSCRR